MKATEPIFLGHRIHLIDGFDMGWAQRTGTYVIAEDELTLVETGPSPSVPYIREGLRRLGFSPEQVKYIIVTHIHLDHAGGAGLFLRECPQAKIVVHPKGARHLVDPSRLIAGARAVYHDDFDRLFDPIVAVPEERIIVRADQETLQIGANCVLEFWDTPGHANHHFSIYDPVSRGMFTGDTAGVFYPQLQRDGIHFVLPSTSPNQFDPQAMLRSVERFEQRGLARIYFGHFGMTDDVADVYRQVREWLPVFVAEGEAVVAAGLGDGELAERLFGRVLAHLQSFGIGDGHEVLDVLRLDLQVCAMGIVDYLQKRRK
ncbi:MBL fold metallo-hydrolase [Brevibacillus agri]|uniref:MBL fold metallo-hydrolase n=1 Tax=Brevibacillus agri TaxID=51101 RepID=A0A3M8AW42_9BACL|nr:MULTISPECIES: MBL fold metallo-hydrolase [Brevibacillus]EJL41784.1 Zn-dependent hydrolase, glyoxylase [Brevibacillus sp. CF112]MBG9565140.1 beta-lactamase [Brevibacillus agri]MDR9503292.1 MBL fold metallo-hydrolase [Brevibacillus agri]MED1643623.1 MBL fold metallo-hydrolase [Brevibacillus agri]MED1657113.1 MBL fold metallo-hydrolase [Brevibacillus agri]